MSEISDKLVEAFCRGYTAHLGSDWKGVYDSAKEIERDNAREFIEKLSTAGIEMTLREPTYVVRFTEAQHTRVTRIIGNSDVWDFDGFASKSGILAALQAVEVVR